MGYSIRTDCYRYVEWRQWDTKRIVACDLYDHRGDDGEMVNLADGEEHKTTVDELSKLPGAGWRGAPPPAGVTCVCDAPVQSPPPPAA